MTPPSLSKGLRMANRPFMRYKKTSGPERYPWLLLVSTTSCQTGRCRPGTNADDTGWETGFVSTTTVSRLFPRAVCCCSQNKVQPTFGWLSYGSIGRKLRKGPHAWVLYSSVLFSVPRGLPVNLPPSRHHLNPNVHTAPLNA